MKLITETLFDTESYSELDEARGVKDHFIKGIFLQSEQKNRNGRVYPKPILAKEVKRYITEYVDKNRAIGELNHPSHPEPNPEKASHLITSLAESGNNWVGKAKILNTPSGNIVKGLLDGGVQLGVSSRGLGSLKESNGVRVVQNDYYLSCVDIVANPSAHDAFVNGLMEGVEWIWENDMLVQKELEIIKEKVEKIVRPTDDDLCELFKQAMKAISEKKKTDDESEEDMPEIDGYVPGYVINPKDPKKRKKFWAQKSKPKLRKRSK